VYPYAFMTRKLACLSNVRVSLSTRANLKFGETHLNVNSGEEDILPAVSPQHTSSGAKAVAQDRVESIHEVEEKVQEERLERWHLSGRADGCVSYVPPLHPLQSRRPLTDHPYIPSSLVRTLVLVIASESS
jgi:hypothetical protein